MTVGQKLERLHAHPQFKIALSIVKALHGEGFKAVFAGGCVRDALLWREPKDIDIATSALPEDIEKLFTRTLAVGKAFGTIVVITESHSFEVTTFRKDGPYLDGRHPESVQFSDMEEDAKRRDFTVNALFYDPVVCEIYDYVGGLADLEEQYLRTVGRAQDRFGEDRLRMLRAVRFVAQLKFSLDEAAFAAIQNDFREITRVSAERIFAEMKRLLESPGVTAGLSSLRDSRLAEELWPELAQWPEKEMVAFLPALDWENAFAAVTLLCGLTEGDNRLRRWKAPRDSARRVRAQIAGAQILLDEKSARAARARVLGGEDYAGALRLARGALSGSGEELERAIAEFLKISKQGYLPPPLLNGQDLLELGFAPGAEMGRILKEIFEAQLEGEVNTREAALARLKPTS